MRHSYTIDQETSYVRPGHEYCFKCAFNELIKILYVERFDAIFQRVPGQNLVKYAFVKNDIQNDRLLYISASLYFSSLLKRLWRKHVF